MGIRTGNRFFERPSVRVQFHPLLFLVFAVAAFLTNYPGRLNADSFEQLLQAYDPATLTDWHSPIITWLWKLAGMAGPQPAAALAVQCALFAFFAAVLPVFPKIDRRWAIALAAEAAFRVALIGLAGIVVKDLMLCAMLLCMIACLQLAQTSQRKTPYILSAAGLLVMSLMVRPTNFLFFAAAWAILSLTLFSSVRSYILAVAIATVAMVAAVPVNNAVNRTLLGAHDAHAEKQLIIFDVAGISKYGGHNGFPEWKGWANRDLPDPAGCYWTRQWDPFAFYGRCHGYAETFDSVANMHRQSAISWWLSEVAANPAAYLRHRLAYSRKMFLDPTALIAAGHQVGVTNSVGEAAIRQTYFVHRRGADQIAIWKDNAVSVPLLSVTAAAFSEKAAFLLAVMVCLAVLGWNLRAHFRGEDKDPVLTLVAALGIGNLVMLAFFGVASEGRYLLPTTCCGYLALLMALRSWAARGTGA